MEQEHTETNEICWWQCAVSMVKPLLQALDAFNKGLLQSLMLRISSHWIPAHNEKLETRDDADGQHTFTWEEGLLDIRRLPQCILDLLEPLPFSLTKMEICIGMVVSEAWHNSTCVCQEGQLSDGLLRHVLEAWPKTKEIIHTAWRWIKSLRNLKREPHWVQIHNRSLRGGIPSWTQVTQKNALVSSSCVWTQWCSTWAQGSCGFKVNSKVTMVQRRPS